MAHREKRSVFVQSKATRRHPWAHSGSMGQQKLTYNGHTILKPVCVFRPTPVMNGLIPSPRRKEMAVKCLLSCVLTQGKPSSLVERFWKAMWSRPEKSAAGRIGALMHSGHIDHAEWCGMEPEDIAATSTGKKGGGMKSGELVSVVIFRWGCKTAKALASPLSLYNSFERLKVPDVSRCGIKRLGSTFSLLPVKNPLDVFGRETVVKRFLGTSAGRSRFTGWLVVSTGVKGWGRFWSAWWNFWGGGRGRDLLGTEVWADSFSDRRNTADNPIIEIVRDSW